VQLLTGGDQPPCLRIYRRPDGRVLTADCTTKSERFWKWLRRYSAPAAALFSSVVFGCNWFERTTGKPCMPDPTPTPSCAHEAAHIGQAEQAAVRVQDDRKPAEQENPAAQEADEPKR
jgi:hypothetical protein